LGSQQNKSTEVLEKGQELLGAHHPDVARSRLDVATTYRQLEYLDKAIEHMRKSLEVQMSLGLYDTYTPKLLATKADLAILLVEGRPLKEAEKVQRLAEVASALDAGVPPGALNIERRCEAPVRSSGGEGKVS
jgi:hypothetical protein